MGGIALKALLQLRKFGSPNVGFGRRSGEFDPAGANCDTGGENTTDLS